MDDTDEKKFNVDSLNVSDQAREYDRSKEEALHFEFSPVVYYCKDCKKIVVAVQKRKKIYCPLCNSNSLAMGTERSIMNYYKPTKQTDETEKAPESDKDNTPQND